MMANLLTITEMQTVEGELTLSKYPKTDYTYSPLSRDRVELAPGQVAMPNTSRRSLSQFHVQGALTSAEELERLSAASWTTTTTRKRYTVSPQRAERVTSWRWWPWLLLLLLPPLGYGWYCGHADVPLPAMEGADPADYRAPPGREHGELGARLAALESWARGVDARLLAAGQDLARLHDVDQHVEYHSAHFLRDNLLRALTAGDTAAALADELRKHLDRDYVSREQMDAISSEGEDTLRRILQEHLGAFERRQLGALREHVCEHASGAAGVDEDAVRRVVATMLDVYDADKTGRVDYALESAGGQVISTKCTELYQFKTKQYSILGLPVLWVYTSPRHALTPGAMPAECWAFHGFPGYLVVRTYAIIEVTGFSLEHMSRLLAVDGKIESAPKNFSVYGLQGEMDTEPHLFGDYMYDANGTAIQYFPVQHPKTTDIGGVQYPVAYNMIELRVESNHGNPTYTCLYRFRVHGAPLSDERRAAVDSMRDTHT